MTTSREVRFGLLMSEDESTALTHLAEDEGGLSQGAMVRKLVRAEARRRGLWPPTVQHDTTQLHSRQEVAHEQ
jgi:hypothetical protein